MNTNKIIGLKQIKIDAWLIYQNQGTYEVGQIYRHWRMWTKSLLIDMVLSYSDKLQTSIWIYQSMEKTSLKFER